MPLALRTCATIAEADAALASSEARYLGGGTLLVRAANEGDLTFETFVRSTDARLAAVIVAGGEVTLGASVTMAGIARHVELAEIAKAARAVGGPAVRNMATVGGNLFAPAPYGDFAAALLALDATVLLSDREIPVESMLAERAPPRAVVAAVRFRLPPQGAFRFLKVSRVKPKGVSVLTIAAVIERDADGVVRVARIALNCMAARPMRARAAEAALLGVALTADTIAGAAAVISDGTSPITDPVASAWYRNEVLPVHFRRLLAD